MTTFGDDLIEAMNEAAAIAKGEAEPAAVHHALAIPENPR